MRSSDLSLAAAPSLHSYRISYLNQPLAVAVADRYSASERRTNRDVTGEWARRERIYIYFTFRLKTVSAVVVAFG